MCRNPDLVTSNRLQRKLKRDGSPKAASGLLPQAGSLKVGHDLLNMRQRNLVNHVRTLCPLNTYEQSYMALAEKY